MLVDILCPICRVQGSTQVPDYLLDKTPSGVVAIQIFMKSNCQHSFVAYVDRNGGVRGYQILDYRIEIDYAEEEIPIGFRPLILRELHHILGLAALGHILAALVTEKQIFLVGDETTAVAIAEFFDRILPQPASAGALQPIRKSEYITRKYEGEQTVTIDLETRAILGTPFKTQEIEWFCGPIAMALEIPEAKTAESFLQQEYQRMWNLMNIFQHLVARGIKKDE